MSRPAREALCFTEREWSRRTAWPTTAAREASIVLVMLPKGGFRVEKDAVLEDRVPRRVTVSEAAKLLDAAWEMTK